MVGRRGVLKRPYCLTAGTQCQCSRRILAPVDPACRFGRSPPQDVEEVPSQRTAASAHQRRASAGSLSDLRAADQGQGGTSPARNGRRPQGPPSAATQREQQTQQQQQQQQHQPQLVRHSGNGRLQDRALGQGEDDVLGTWAGRQRIFAEHLRGQERQDAARRALQVGQQEELPPPQQQQQQGQVEPPQHQLQQPPREEREEEGSPAAVVLRPPEPLRAAPAAHGQQRGQPAADSSDLDQEMNAAWR